MEGSAARDSTNVSAFSFYACAAMVGIAAGIVGVAFHTIVDGALTFHEEIKHAINDPLRRIGLFAFLSAAMTSAAVWGVRRYAPEAAGSGVQEIEGTLEDKRALRWKRVLPIKFLCGGLALSSGLVLGREGPTIHMGASAGLGIALRAGMPRTEQKALIAAGAAAGLASAFNAPVAAVLFVIEETRTQFPWTFRTYNAVILASALAAVVTELVAGVGPDLTIAGISTPPLQHLPAFALLGILLGVIGVFFNTVLIQVMDFVAMINRRVPYLFATLFGGLIGALIVVFPYATGGGDELIPRLIEADTSILFLLLLVVVRGVTTFGSYATGVPGGIFAPMLALATCIGLAFASIVVEIVPSFGVDKAALAAAAMGGLFAATVRAPLVGVVLVAELTGAYELMLASLVTCGIANLTAHQLKGEPIYELLLARTLKLAHAPTSRQDERVPIQLGVRD